MKIKCSNAGKHPQCEECNHAEEHDRIFVGHSEESKYCSMPGVCDAAEQIVTCKPITERSENV